MSHIVTIETQVRDPAAVAAACRRLGVVAPQLGVHRLYSSKATGLGVQLPGWRFPLVCDTATGKLAYDNFGGHWGEQAQFDQFLQAYACEMAKIRSPPPRALGRRAAAFRRLDQADHPGRRRCRIMKTIEIIISPTGQAAVQTKGFAGSSCQDASRFIEQALGQKTGEQLTAEFHQTAEAETQRQSQ